MEKNQREEMLINNIYEELSKSSFSWSSIRNIIDEVGAEKLIEFVDIDKIMQLPNSERYFSVLLQLDDNSLISEKIAKDEKYQKYFFEKLDNIYGDAARMDSNDVKSIVRSIGNKGKTPDNFDLFLSAIDGNISAELLKEELPDELLLKLAQKTDKESLQNFIYNNPKALQMYPKIGINKMIDMGIKFPKDILRQPEFFEKLKGSDMVEMRRNINRLYSENYSPEIEKKLNEYRESIISQYNSEKEIFNDYDIKSREELNRLDGREKDFILDGDVNYEMHSKIDNKEEFQNYLKETTRRKMSEVIMDSLFNDTKNNVLINIEEITRYCSKVDQDIVSREDLQLYNKIKNIDSLSSNELLVMYNSLKDKNMTGKFYSDISALREKSHKDISESLYKTDNNPEDVSITDANEKGIESYKLQGKPFYMLVRTLNKNYKEKSHNEQSSYSLISGNNPHVFHEWDVEDNESFLYGYDYVDPKSIVNVFEVDSYTTSESQNMTTRPNRIMTPEEIADSENYSEINIKNKPNQNYDGINDRNKYIEMKPSYLVSLNKEISQKYIEESKRLGIPVVTIDREKYKDNVTKNIEYQQYNLDIN